MARPPPDPVFTLRGSAAPVNTLHFHCSRAGPPTLYSGSGKGSVHVWNLNTRRAETVLDGHNGASVIWIRTVRATDTFLSQGRDMRVCVWDLAEGRAAVTHSLHTGSVGFCQCSLLESTRTLLALPTQHTEEIKVVELETQTPVCSLIPDSTRGMLMCMKMWQADSGPLLCAGYEDGSLVLWDVSNRRPLSCLKAHPDPVMCLDVDSGRQKGVSGSSDQNLISWSFSDQQNLQVQDSVPLTNPGVSQVRIRGDGRIVATAGWDCSVRVFGWRRLKPLAVLQHHQDPVQSLEFSDHQDPTQRLLAAGSTDQRISMWSIYTHC
ncbi:guanine nucleotide-binding protein subunit beta-like protein 1 [Astyanax mexicanus]|uniref:Guanine nucleotide-binding protein subunit beta-like protein 1 n=1 Tax=Astyanax mexicanus TaxID=7994 RepID=A0A8T2KTR4_ASTMX|nr:guanine nucleotide-binding protein subunit beta-like protein 1 [Astyanax mexicanus]